MEKGTRKHKNVWIFAALFGVVAVAAAVFGIQHVRQDRAMQAELSLQDGTPYIKYEGSDDWERLGGPIAAPSSWAASYLDSRRSSEYLVDCPYEMQLTSPKNGWLVASVGHGVGGADTYVYRTHDGGHTWGEVGRPEDASWYPSCVSFLDDEHAIIGIGLYVNAPIYQTSDGGATWEEVKIPLHDGKWEATSITYENGVVDIEVHDLTEGGEDARLTSRDIGETWEADIL